MKALLEILNSNQMTLSRRNIEAILFEELAKDPEEMDVELIEICAKALDGAYSQPDSEESKKKVVKLPTKKNVLRKVFLTAAVLMMSVSIGLPVAAKCIDNPFLNNIVQYIGDHFSINLTQDKQTAINHSDNKNALIKKLEEIGYENIILPSVFLEYKYSDDDIQVTINDDSFLTTQINIKLNSKIEGFISITKYKKQDAIDILGKGELSSQLDSIEQVHINGIDIIVSSSDDYTLLTYIDESTEYLISLTNCNLETGLKIAKNLYNK